MVYHLFKYSVEYLRDLFEKYPVLLKFIKKSNSFWNKIIDFSYFDKLPKAVNYFLPTFKKELPINRKVIFSEKIGLDKINNF
jgi:lantibiotic modifying enzyme